MTIPRPMGRSTPSPAGARTEHWSAGCLRSSGLVTPICQNGKTANVSRHTVTEEYQAATHRTGEKRRPFQGRWHKAQRTPPTVLYNTVAPFLVDFQVPPKAKSVAAQVLNKITSDIPSRHPASRSTHSRNTSST